MSGEITIPALPCRSIKETLEFYVALGFEITYQQERPNNYGCVKRGDIDIHFFTMKGYEPKDSYSTCVVLVPDLAALHQAFSAGLRAHFGKVPVAGIPRISKLNNSNSDHQLRFNVIDPGGNWVRFAQIGEPSAEGDTAASPNKEQSKLSRAVQAADWLVEAHGDFEQAAQMLDKALERGDETPAAHRVQGLILRASLAISLDDKLHARTLLDQAREIQLSDSERADMEADFQRADDLAKMLE